MTCAGELAQIARVSRTLSLFRADQIDGEWIAGLPKMDFPQVEMSCPNYLVEISTLARDSGSDVDSDSDTDDGTNS